MWGVVCPETPELRNPEDGVDVNNKEMKVDYMGREPCLIAHASWTIFWDSQLSGSSWFRIRRMETSGMEGGGGVGKVFRNRDSSCCQILYQWLIFQGH